MSEKRVAVGDKNTTSARFVDPREGNQPPPGRAVHHPPMSRLQEAMLRALLEQQKQELEASQYEYDRRSEMFDADRADGVHGNLTGTGRWKAGEPDTGLLLHEMMRLRKGRPIDA
jgi:hypothetical protein